MRPFMKEFEDLLGVSSGETCFVDDDAREAMYACFMMGVSFSYRLIAQANDREAVVAVLDRIADNVDMHEAQSTARN